MKHLVMIVLLVGAALNANASEHLPACGLVEIQNAKAHLSDEGLSISFTPTCHSTYEHSDELVPFALTVGYDFTVDDVNHKAYYTTNVSTLKPGVLYSQFIPNKELPGLANLPSGTCIDISSYTGVVSDGAHPCRFHGSPDFSSDETP